MLLISRIMGMWKRTCIFSLCSIVKLLFSPVSMFSSLLQLPIASPDSQIIKELFSYSSYSFHIRHLSVNGIMKKAISPQNMTNPIGFYTQYIIYKRPLLTYKLKHSPLVTFSGHFIFSILLQHRNCKLSKYFLSNFISVHVSEPYKAMLKI